MGRCFPARLFSDAINAVPAAACANLRKLLGLYRRESARFVLVPCDAAERLVLARIRWLDVPIRWTVRLTVPCRPLRPSHCVAA